MPEHIRSLIVIIALSTIAFTFVKKIVGNNIAQKDLNRWRNIWFFITSTAFLAHNFWIYLLLSAAAILYVSRYEKNRSAYFFVLFVIIPPINSSIPGFGMVNYIIEIDYLRLVALTCLLPSAILIAGNNNFKFTKCKTDNFILFYMFFYVGLYLRDTTFTDTARQGVYVFLETFLPYYVISRSIKTKAQMNYALFSFVTIAFVIAFIVALESTKHWLLYASLANALGAKFGYGGYISRASSLRAIGSLAHPIILGLYMTVSLGIYLYLSQFIQKPLFKRLGYFVLTVGLLAPVSRGPWTGAVAMLITYILLGPKAIKRISTFVFICSICFVSLFFVPNGQKYLDLIPFYGKTDKVNIDYREKLFHNSMAVISKNPMFGSINYLETPEMQEMIQGEGIIDLVNFYIALLLERGYTGLMLFVGAFIATILGIRKKMKLYTNKNSDMHNLGRSLIATIIGIMVILVGASSVGAIAYIYWSVIGLGVAYWRMQELNA
jgi:O-Antigen ligase